MRLFQHLDVNNNGSLSRDELFDFMNKKQGEGSELTYDSIRFEKLSPDLVEALMPVLTMLYNHA